MAVEPPPIPSGLVFPLHDAPTASYHESPRSFGSARRGGRKHGGCDLYAPAGTAVRAMFSGTVAVALYEFYGGTYALEVNHGSFYARYGEISRTTAESLAVGDTISAGQAIGVVGKLNNYHETMVHMELFTGVATGSLTDRSNPPYMRRSDLFDPTSWLDAVVPR